MFPPILMFPPNILLFTALRDLFFSLLALVDLTKALRTLLTASL